MLRLPVYIFMIVMFLTTFCLFQSWRKMKLYISFLVIALVGALTDEDIQDINRMVEEVMRCHNIPGLGLAIVHEGETVLQEGYGYANVEV